MSIKDSLEKPSDDGTITVYCDRVSIVRLNNNRIDCPKCEGQCIEIDTLVRSFDCTRCLRRWEQVPNRCKNNEDAEKYLEWRDTL